MSRTGTVRRQRRGLERMAQILEVAEGLFGAEGVEAVTTNRIAREAGMSPGSLYQFFDSKDAIVGALARGYAAELAAIHLRSFEGLNLSAVSTLELVDAVVDPIIGYKNSHAGFAGLVARSQVPAHLMAPIVQVDQVFEADVRHALIVRNPQAPVADVAAATSTMFAIFRAVIGSVEPSARGGLELAELKSVFVGYLVHKGLH